MHAELSQAHVHDCCCHYGGHSDVREIAGCLKMHSAMTNQLDTMELRIQ